MGFVCQSASASQSRSLCGRMSSSSLEDHIIYFSQVLRSASSHDTEIRVAFARQSTSALQCRALCGRIKSSSFVNRRVQFCEKSNIACRRAEKETGNRASTGRCSILSCSVRENKELCL